MPCPRAEVPLPEFPHALPEGRRTPAQLSKCSAGGQIIWNLGSATPAPGPRVSQRLQLAPVRL